MPYSRKQTYGTRSVQRLRVICAGVIPDPNFGRSRVEWGGGGGLVLLLGLQWGYWHPENKTLIPRVQ